MNADDKAKTGCVGILMPLACVLYAIVWFVSPESVSTRGIRPIRGSAATGFGISTLGLALFVHALGFVPYGRIPGLKYLLGAAGVGLFVLGLLWEHVTADDEAGQD